MTETEAEENLNVEEEADEDEYLEVEEEGGEVVDEDEEPEVVITGVKKRRCQKRKKVRPIYKTYIEGEDDYEDFQLFYEDEDEEEEEEVEDEESDAVSYTSSVLSGISFVWEDKVYEFEELCDPGKIETIYLVPFFAQDVVEDNGESRYLEVCASLNICPMRRILQSLKTNEMDLGHRNVHGKNIRALCAALENNNNVERLIMRFNKLEVDDCYYIGLILSTNEKISYLDFTSCRVGPEGLELLITHLPKNEYVVELNLSRCEIGDEGMKILSRALTRNNSVQKLDLSYNKLQEESGDSLALALKMNSSITHLKLRYNNLFDPASMKGFFRSLISNNSISYLDLSWNGMSGAEMGGYISNYLKRSGSIQYLDLSDNRFEGPAVLAIKKGLSKSRSLETLKLGKNPIEPELLDSLLSGAGACYNLKVLDLNDLWVNKSFIKILKKIQLQREIEVNFAGIFGDYEVFGPDYPKIILQRAQFEAQKPKKAKQRKDFGHLMWTLGNEPITQNDFMQRAKKFKAKVNKELYPELLKQFIIPKVNLIDVVAMRQKYLSLFPDSTPPPPPKGKKGKPGQQVEESVAVEQVQDTGKPSEPEVKEKKAEGGAGEQPPGKKGELEGNEVVDAAEMEEVDETNEEIVEEEEEYEEDEEDEYGEEGEEEEEEDDEEEGNADNTEDT